LPDVLSGKYVEAVFRLMLFSSGENAAEQAGD
jgi:hypothetical protein